MCSVNAYLSKHQFTEPSITTPPNTDTNIIVVIPCFDEPDLLPTLQSLWHCDRPKSKVEVIIVINASEKSPIDVLQRNEQTHKKVQLWISEHQDDTLHFFSLLHQQLPKKFAGVGLARKIGMDEAVARFHAIGNEDGIIVGFDADSRCDTNYLTAIEEHFTMFPETPACSIYFEHPTEGNSFPQEVYNGIVHYELFLRYYRQSLLFAKFPYAYHTVGSSFAVRSSIYQKQGGMNRRKAGEDFYFLQKIIPLGNYSELLTTRVIPSPRPSNRVPFGTGKAIQDWLDANETLFTYHPQTFIDLKAFCEKAPMLYTDNTLSFSESINYFLSQNNFKQHLDEIRTNSASLSMFIKRFFRWFNAFMVLKYVHFARDNYYKDIPITDAAKQLLQLMKKETHHNDATFLLHFYRALDKKVNTRTMNLMFAST